MTEGFLEGDDFMLVIDDHMVIFGDAQENHDGTFTGNIYCNKELYQSRRIAHPNHIGITFDPVDGCLKRRTIH